MCVRWSHLQLIFAVFLIKVSDTVEEVSGVCRALVVSVVQWIWYCIVVSIINGNHNTDVNRVLESDSICCMQTKMSHCIKQDIPF